MLYIDVDSQWLLVMRIRILDPYRPLYGVDLNPGGIQSYIARKLKNFELSQLGNINFFQILQDLI